MHRTLFCLLVRLLLAMRPLTSLSSSMQLSRIILQVRTLTPLMGLSSPSLTPLMTRYWPLNESSVSNVFLFPPRSARQFPWPTSVASPSCLWAPGRPTPTSRVSTPRPWSRPSWNKVIRLCPDVQLLPIYEVLYILCWPDSNMYGRCIYLNKTIYLIKVFIPIHQDEND